MKAIVDQDACVGCGLCVDTCPEVFEMVEGLAQIIGSDVPEGVEDTCKEAAECCPVDAITIED